MNKYRRFAKDTALFAIGNIGSKLLSFLFIPFYTSYLSTGAFGDSDIIVTTISLLLPVLSIGISEGVLRFCQEKGNDINEVFNIGFRFIVIANICEIAIVTILSFFWMLIGENFYLFIFLFLFISIEELFSYYVKGINKTSVFAIKGIIFTVVFIISNIVLLKYFDLGLKGYLLSHIIAYLVSSLFMFIAGKIFSIRLSLSTNRELLKNMIIYSVAFVPSTIAWWINSSADKYMLVGLIGSSSNGLYSVAQKIPTFITALTTIVTQAWQLSAMRTYGDKDFNDFFSEIFNLLSVILVFGFGLIFVFNRHLSYLLFKKDFFEAWKFVPMLTVAAVFSTISGFLASAFTSSKKTKMLFVSTCIAALVNVVINYFLILSIGEFGVAVATAFSFLIIVLIRLLTMKSLVKLKTNYWIVFLSYFIMLSSSFAIIYFKNYYLISLLTFLALLLLNLPNIIKIINIIIIRKKKKIQF